MGYYVPLICIFYTFRNKLSFPLAVLVRFIRLRLRLITCTSTLIILDIMKTSSNYCLMFVLVSCVFRTGPYIKDPFLPETQRAPGMISCIAKLQKFKKSFRIFFVKSYPSINLLGPDLNAFFTSHFIILS